MLMRSCGSCCLAHIGLNSDRSLVGLRKIMPGIYVLIKYVWHHATELNVLLYRNFVGPVTSKGPGHITERIEGEEK